MDAVSGYSQNFQSVQAQAALNKAQSQSNQSFTIPNWQNKAADATAQKKAAQDYEGVFISQMLTPMFDTVDTDPEFGGGDSEKIYKSMMVQEYGKQLAARGGIGLAKYIQNDLAHGKDKQQQTITGAQ